MEVSKKELTPMFKSLGFKATVDQWNVKRFQSKVESLPQLAEGKTLADEDESKLLKKILKSLAAGKTVTVVDGNGKPAADPGAVASAAKGKKGTKDKPTEPEPEDTDDDTEEEEEEGEEESEEEEEGEEADDEEGPPKPKKDKGKGKAKGEGPKKVGVIDNIVTALKTGTSKKPLTKADILAHLTKKHPDRDPEGMKKTINIQVPSRLRNEKKLDIQKNENGYWIPA